MKEKIVLTIEQSQYRKYWQAFLAAHNAAEKRQTGIYAKTESMMRASGIKGDDAKGRRQFNDKLRNIVGIKTFTRVTGSDGKQAPKSAAWSTFDGMLSACWRRVFPRKPTDKKVDGKPTDKKVDGKQENKMMKGLSDRMSAYALVLQDAATAKTHAALSTNEAKQLEKLLGKLKALAELGYPD